MEVLQKEIKNGSLHVTLRALPAEYRMEAGEAVENAISRLFGRFLAEEGLRAVGRPRVTEAACPADGSLRFTVEAELYPEVKLGQYKGIRVKARREENEAAFMKEVLEKACANMEAEVTQTLIDQRLAAMIAGEHLNVDQDSIYYLLADVVEILGEVYQMAGCRRPAAQVEAEALDILLQAVSADNQGPEIEYLKDQMYQMAARYSQLPEDFPELIDSAFARRKKKKGRMSPAERSDEAFHAYLRTVGMDEEQLKRERRPAAAAAARCDLLFEAVAQAEGLTVYQDEMDEVLARLADKYHLSVEEVTEAVDTEPMRMKLLRDRACRLILDSAVGGADG